MRRVQIWYRHDVGPIVRTPKSIKKTTILKMAADHRIGLSTIWDPIGDPKIAKKREITEIDLCVFCLRTFFRRLRRANTEISSEGAAQSWHPQSPKCQLLITNNSWISETIEYHRTPLYLQMGHGERLWIEKISRPLGPNYYMQISKTKLRGVHSLSSMGR